MRKEVPDSAVEHMGAVVDHLLALGILHTDLHELLEDRIIPVVVVFEFVEERLHIRRHTF